MKDLGRRLKRLEGEINTMNEVDPFHEQLRERLNDARDRLKLWGYDVSPMVHGPSHNANMSLAERLKAARERLCSNTSFAIKAKRTNGY